MADQMIAEIQPRDGAAPELTQADIDQRVFDLHDEYCHGRIDRRSFLSQAAAVTAGGLVMAQALLPRYARAQTISFTDARIKATYVTYPSPGGNSGTMRGYLVQPTGSGPFPVVLVIHENRGLNPYIEDVARRAAVAGFLALSSGKMGVTGFCWGGSTTNFLAATLGADVKAAVPYYGAAAETAAVPNIKAALMIQYAQNDERINTLWPGYEAALKSAGVRYEMFMYPGTQHGFHNNSTPRYDEAAAEQSWDRTIGFFKQQLA